LDRQSRELYIVDKESIKNPLSTNIEEYGGALLFVVDKPLKWSSADVVRQAKGLLQRWFMIKKIKVGHTGTLDPLATGVILICVGKATKLANHFQAQPKEYIAEITFGATTPSYDLEKEFDNFYSWEHITKESIKKALLSFIGEQQQIPPLYSAKMVGGKRAYLYARDGVEVPLSPSTITIDRIELLEWSAPLLKIKIECSKGTYIRSLVRDLGVELGSGAHLSGLIRTGSGNFRVENGLSIEELKLFLKKCV